MGSSLSTTRRLERLKHHNIQHQSSHEQPLYITDLSTKDIQDTNNDPMLAAASKLSQQYDNEHAVPSLTTSTDNDSTLPSSATTDRFAASIRSSKDLMLQALLKRTSESDKRRERDRQQRLKVDIKKHYMLKRAFNGIYKARIEDPKLIVNWSCGIGLWDMEMAEKFPQCKIIAIDFVQAPLANLRDSLANVEFRECVIDETHTGMESIESGTVDYVMMKDCWLINSPSHKWTNVLDQVFRILKPNGWIELSENALRIESQGKNMAQLDTYFAAFFNEMEIDRNIAEKLGDLLEFSGFNSIEKTAYTIPVGDWPAAKDSKEMGFLFKDVLEKRLRNSAKWLSIVNDVEENEIQQIISISLDEEIVANRSHVDWFSYTARKPNNESGPNKSSAISNNNFIATTLTPTTSQHNVTSQSLQI